MIGNHYIHTTVKAVFVGSFDVFYECPLTQKMLNNDINDPPPTGTMVSPAPSGVTGSKVTARRCLMLSLTLRTEPKETRTTGPPL